MPIKIKKIALTALAVVPVAFFPLAAVGQVKFERAAKTWATAAVVDLQRGEYVSFARLDPSGDSRFLTWVSRANDKIHLTLSVPVSASADFKPQLVLFQPESTTAGPVLPFDQPPDTLAMIYPAKLELRCYEGLTQVRYTVVFQKTLTLPVAGQYYLAVYNPSRYPGSVRLTVTDGRENCWRAVVDYPTRWWYSQAWAGLSPDSVFMPGAAVALAGAIFWLVMTVKNKPSPKTGAKKITKKR